MANYGCENIASGPPFLAEPSKVKQLSVSIAIGANDEFHPNFYLRPEVVNYRIP